MSYSLDFRKQVFKIKENQGLSCQAVTFRDFASHAVALEETIRAQNYPQPDRKKVGASKKHQKKTQM